MAVQVESRKLVRDPNLLELELVLSMNVFSDSPMPYSRPIFQPADTTKLNDVWTVVGDPVCEVVEYR